MAKKPRQKKLGVKDLLELMGVDPNEPAPTGLREAEWHRDLEGGSEERAELERCPASGKVMFSSESQARAASKRRLRKGSNASAFRVYRCPDCGGNYYHLTSQVKS